MRLADYITAQLCDQGLTNVYLVTGRGSIYLSDALARREDIQAISMHHEQSAGYAAVAEATLTDQLSACFVSTGCGSTNAISAVLTAWQDEIPVIFISGQNSLHETTRYTECELRTFGEQEADIVAMVKPITKFAAMLEDPKDIERLMSEAITAATSGRRGPVWLDIPLDLQSAQVNPANIGHTNAETLEDRLDVIPIVNLFEKSERPVILLGPGSTRGKAREKILYFAHKFNVPIVYDSGAVDVVPWDDPLHVGSVGAMGCSRAGNFALQNSDLVLVLGSSLRSTLTGEDPTSFAREAKVIHVDVDNTQLRVEKPHIDLHISISIEKFLSKINLIEPIKTNVEWAQTCAIWKRELPNLIDQDEKSEVIDLHQLADELGPAMAPNSVLVTDSGLTELILPTNIHLGPEQRCIHPFSQGAMGYALPAAVGAALGSSRPIVVAVGDGSIMMNIQELQTIYHHKLNIKIIITNNNAYAVIRKRQVDLFRGRTIGTDSSNGVSCPNYESVAGAFGIPYSKIQKRKELFTNLARCLSGDGPGIIEVFTDPEQDYLRTGRVQLMSRKSVIRPLEDQIPYLERNFFNSQMVVPTHNAEQ